MGRYGYLDCEEGYSDVAGWIVEATCARCGATVHVLREDCWNPSDLEEDGWLCECGCTEYDEDPNLYESQAQVPWQQSHDLNFEAAHAAWERANGARPGEPPENWG